MPLFQAAEVVSDPHYVQPEGQRAHPANHLHLRPLLRILGQFHVLLDLWGHHDLWLLPRLSLGVHSADVDRELSRCDAVRVPRLISLFVFLHLFLIRGHLLPAEYPALDRLRQLQGED